MDNLFQLVLLAAQRARRLANGAEPTVAWENDKPTVVALREIAEGSITAEMLREPEPPPVEAADAGCRIDGLPCPPVRSRRLTSRL